jgi:hypothetical protein
MLERFQSMSREEICGKYFVPVKRKTETGVRYMIIPVKCKSWDCPECRKEKAKAYSKRVKKMFDGRKLWMMTLTYYHNVDETTAWKTYNEAWNRLRTNLVKQFGKFSFVKVLESHKKSNYPHLHLIVDRYFRPMKLSPAVLAAGFGYQMQVKEITSDQGRTYVLKYLQKEWSNEAGRRQEKSNRCRRISFSRDLAPDPDDRERCQCLGLQTDYAAAREAIDIDRTFDCGHRYSLVREVDFDGLYQADYEIEDRRPEELRRNDCDSWQPDDWTPR